MIQEKPPGLSADRPFVGLRPFGSSDHAYFFGREDQVYSLFRLLDRGRFIAVVGSSGSGKSSLVRAGLLPILEQESAGHGGRQWRWIEMRPGDAPLDNLAHEVAKLAHEDGPDADAMASVREGRIASALRRSSFGLGKSLSEIPSLEGQTILLVVDQFEELFRFAHAGTDAVANAKWREEAAHFVQTLLEATRERAVAIHVLITMRSDFIGDCAQFYGLPEAVSATQFLVPSTTRDQREQIITAPVAKAGATIDPLLVEQLLNDVSDELDQLPVLQHCLMRLWEAARAAAPSERPHLAISHYDSIGRAQGALSQHAEEIFAGLQGKEMAVEQMFRAIAEIDSDGRVIRRALPFHALVAETGIASDALRSVCDRFRADDCSFLVPSPAQVRQLADETPVDVGHEALLRRWGRIGARSGGGVENADEGGWLVEEERDGRKYRALLALVEGRRGRGRVTLPVDQVQEWMDWWNERPRTPAWAERYGGKFARIERLLSDSVAALAEEKARAARQARFDRFFRVAAVCALVVIVALAGVATYEWRSATAARITATQESQMMFGQMTRLLYSSFENFRLIPHSENGVTGLISSTRKFQNQYADWARIHLPDTDSSTGLDASLNIVKASMALIPGKPSQSMRDMDRIEPNLAKMDDDPDNVLLKAEFHCYRGTAARYDDLFERARADYNMCVQLARRITEGDRKAAADYTVATEAESLVARALRILVEVDTSAHIITHAPDDLKSAVADNRAYGALLDKKAAAQAGRAVTSCGDLSNVGASLPEKWIHNGLVEIEQGKYQAAVADYTRYVELKTFEKSCPGDPFLTNIQLSSGRLGYAKALTGAGQLDEAQKQLDLADQFYESEMKPGDKDNAFALHSDDQVHWVRGELALKQKNPAKAKADFLAALVNTKMLTDRDPDNAREWDDAWLALDGLARAEEMAGNASAAAAQHDAAAKALAKANDIRNKFQAPAQISENLQHNQ